jgi:hypothetical protein
VAGEELANTIMAMKLSAELKLYGRAVPDTLNEVKKLAGDVAPLYCL